VRSPIKYEKKGGYVIFKSIQRGHIMDKQCTKCKETKPSKQFKRLLTRAQTIARGYAGNFRVEIDSKLCKTCQPKPKKPSKLNEKEIKNKVATGDLRAHQGEELLKKYRKKVRQTRHDATFNRWKEARRPLWDAMFEEVKDEIVKTRQQVNHIQKQGLGHDVTFLREYIQMLIVIREEIKFRGYRLGENPKHARWQDYVSPEDQRRLVGAWREFCKALPHSYLLRARIPVLLNEGIR